MIGYIIAGISSLIYGYCSESKSGRVGEWGYVLSSIGFIGIIIGAIVVWINVGLLQAFMTLVIGYIGATLINKLKK